MRPRPRQSASPEGDIGSTPGISVSPSLSAGPTDSDSSNTQRVRRHCHPHHADRTRVAASAITPMSMTLASCQSADTTPLLLKLPLTHQEEGGHGAGSSTDPRQQVPASAKKRLSLPFRRSSQVVASAISDVDIYYGSMTGTAARFAALLAKDTAARGVNTTLQSLEYFDTQRFVNQESLATAHASVFVVSMHFAGGASPSAEVFYQWLKLVSNNGCTHHIVGPPRAAINLALEQPETKVSLENKTHAASVPHANDITAASTAKTPGTRAVKETKAGSPMQLLLNWGRELGKKHRLQEKTLLDGIQCAVFGVGSSDYLTYNGMAKFVDARLHALGAVRLCPLGLGDVSEDAEAAFSKWKATFLQQLPTIPHNIRSLAFEHDLVLTREDTVAAAIRARRHSNATRQRSTGDNHDADEARLEEPASVSRFASVLSWRASVTSPHGALDDVATTRSPKHFLQLRQPNVCLQSISLLCPSNNDDRVVPLDSQEKPRKEVALIRLARLDKDMEYETADTFGCIPRNSAAAVERIATRLGFSLDTWIELYFESTRDKQYQKQHHLPFTTPCTVRTALTEFLEIQTVTREFVRVASGFVAEDRERDALEHLASTDGSTEFNKQFVKRNKGISELLELAPSLQIPFEVFVNIAPLIKPRLYSIACSHLKHPGYIELAVDLGCLSQEHGVSITYFRGLMELLHDKKPLVMLRGFISPSPFKIPEEMTDPMIMITNGIGIAPMRALLEHRKLECDRRADYTVLEQGQARPFRPRNLFFYGCRDSSSIVFEKELREWEKEGFSILKLAYSAEPEHAKEYVQDVVALHPNEITELTKMSRDTRIYVYGKAAMARSVRDVLKTDQYLDEEDGRGWFDKLVENDQYIEDAF
ncbi:Nadph-cytochrome p450, partial [Globisporangium splendens]